MYIYIYIYVYVYVQYMCNICICIYCCYFSWLTVYPIPISHLFTKIKTAYIQYSTVHQYRGTGQTHQHHQQNSELTNLSTLSQKNNLNLYTKTEPVTVGVDAMVLVSVVWFTA